MKYPAVHNVIAGSPKEASDALPALDVFNPGDGSILSRVPMSGHHEVDLAVQAAHKVWPAWAATPIKERVQVFYKYKTLLEQHIAELAALITEENGKIDSEARAEILKSAELTEFACSLPQIPAGAGLEVPAGGERPLAR